MKFFKFIIIFFLGFFASSQSFASDKFCSRFYQKPKINLYTNKGSVLYNHKLSSPEIEQIAKKSNNSNHKEHITKGLTVANFYTSIKIGILLSKQNDILCATTNQIDYTIGYKNFDIYIDKKYDKNSCEYDTILKHENTHLKIFQTSIDYYAPYFASAIKKSLQNIKTIKINSPSDTPKIRNEIQKKLNKDLDHLLKFYQDIVNRENGKLDTKENYIATNKLCNNW